MFININNNYFIINYIYIYIYIYMKIINLILYSRKYIL